MPAHKYTARYVKVCVVCKTEFLAKQERVSCCSQSCRDALRRRGKDNPKLHEPIMQRNHWHPVIDGMRKCAVCGEVKPVAEYYSITHSKKLTTYLHGICKSCDLQSLRARTHNRTSEQRQAQRARTAQKNGKVYIPGGLAARREYNKLNNQERFDRAKSIKEARAAWKEWISIRAPKQWLDEYWANHPKQWLDPRLTDAEQYRIKYKICIEFQIQERMRRQVRKAKTRDGIATIIYAALKNNGQSKKVERELGYSIDELKRHIEKQFTKRMTWDKLKAGLIHIDHILPKASFDLSDPDEWRACWALTNLRPIWAKDNLEKRDKIIYLL